ncbi:MAG TPA: sigma-70 family RNA polymerase sigma factor [Pyrinomonadaceae bacterium]|nr:sigma-70 family RNA polymerase sigma factor [Pyrinomonadaceae bacterium]
MLGGQYQECFVRGLFTFGILDYNEPKFTPEKFMHNDVSQKITGLLVDWNNGDPKALDQLMPLVYDELRAMARRNMRRQVPQHSFQTTDLIHEAYLKLAKQEGQTWQNRSHFFGVAAKAMRHILVDYARSKQSEKRGGRHRVELSNKIDAGANRSSELLALEDALKALESLDPRKSQVVELKFFAGLTNEQTSEVLKISTESVKRDWRFARNWLLREMAGAG